MNTINNQEQKIIVPLGQALKDARVAADLTVDDIALQLNLGPATVRDLEEGLDHAIETGKYAPIYLRGYLVNYARLVDLAGLEQFIEYQKLTRSEKKKRTLKTSKLMASPTRKRSRIWLVFIFVIIAAAVAVFIQQGGVNLSSAVDSSTDSSLNSADKAEQEKMQNQPADKLSTVQVDNSPLPDAAAELSAPQSQESTPVPLPESDAPEIQDADKQTERAVVALETAPKAVDDNLQQEAKVDTDNVEVSSETEKLLAAADDLLKLAFSADCWTEIVDATGKRLAFGLYTDGRVLTLNGTAPFKLVLGDPSVVEIQYQDKVIERDFAAGRTARFSIPQ
ncbi:RodZ domain-containing protein [Psychromonas ossibalaenae]|uniref:RodZ domain-containing protein n=1 Tax=Psychromonas ossibalaenae TaxID=444922 RepID=UPI0003610DD5|nr:RodZ domain-containing protein [Psychromonas ossibalaenae]